jgi:hydroxymethylpyrimidine/phosphomethylpyrimidine kinase
VTYTPHRMNGRVLVVAGSDSGGGAGIQADIKTVTALGGFAMTAVTALTAQNTEGVFGVSEVAPDFVAKQIELTLTDIGADCVKTGMLHSAAVIDAVMDALERHAPGVPLVADPVMVAKGGARLLRSDAITTLTRRLLLRATVLTPNLGEAEALTGLEIRDLDAMKHAAEMLLSLGAQAVLVKGGHMPGDVVRDVLAGPDGLDVLEGERIQTRHTHGTGCTLASAIATGLAQGMTIRHAVVRARGYVREAIATAPGFGRGHGPLNHAHTVTDFPPRRGGHAKT